MSTDFNSRPKTPPAPDMPTFEGTSDLHQITRRKMWMKFALGVVWMVPVGYFLVNGQALTVWLEGVPSVAPYVKSGTIVLALLSVVSVLAMAMTIRRAIFRNGPIALPVGMAIGFAAGCGPAEIMAQLSS